MVISCIGSTAMASTGVDSTLYGTDSIASGAYSNAFGYKNTASGESATAIGAQNTASGENAFAAGVSSTASGAESLAIGKTASATSGRSLAVGTNAKATGANSVAVGSGAGNSGPLWFASSIDSSRSVVNTLKTVNYATTAEGDNAVALGFYANAKNTGVAVGQNALAATGGVAIGKGVFEDTNNNLAGGVAIGQDSASTGINSLAMGRHAFAAGSTSMAIGYEASANGNFAVAMGRNVTANGTSTAIGRNATASNGGLAIGSQDNDASSDITTASAKGAVAIGKNTTASSEDTVAIGTNAKATIDNSVALGNNAKTNDVVGTSSIAINGETHTFAGGTPVGTVSVGDTGKERTITNVAAGRIDADSTDAINGSQLNAVINSLNFTTVVDGNNTTVTESTNINGGKEFKVDVNKDINLTNNGSVTIGDTEIKNGEITVGDKNDIHTVLTTGQLGVSGPDGGTAIMSAAISLENNVDGSNSVVETKGLTAVDANGREVTFTTDGISAGNQVISNVADGVKDTDVATVGQLKANVSTESVVADNQVDNIATVSVTNGKSTGDANAQYGVYVSRTTVDSIAKASNLFAGDDVIKVERWSAPSNVADLTTFSYDGTKAATKTPLTYKANGTIETTMLSDGLNFTNGNNTTASVGSDGVVKYDLNKDITVDSVTAGKANIGDVVIDNNGINAGGQIISNVKAGVAGTDAVNVSQLKEVESKITNINQNVINQANQYTDSQVAQVGAQSAALAGLHPLDFNKDDKASYAASVGHYRNANAVAVGAFYRPNERTMVSGAISFGKHAQMNLGVAFKTGKGSEYINEAKSKDSRIEKLEALVNKLTAEVEELKTNK